MSHFDARPLSQHRVMQCQHACRGLLRNRAGLFLEWAVVPEGTCNQERSLQPPLLRPAGTFSGLWTWYRRRAERRCWLQATWC